MSLYFAFVITSKSLNLAPLANLHRALTPYFEPRPDNCCKSSTLLEESLVSTRAVTARNTFVLELVRRHAYALLLSSPGEILSPIVSALFGIGGGGGGVSFLLSFFSSSPPRSSSTSRRCLSKGLLFRMHHFASFFFVFFVVVDVVPLVSSPRRLPTLCGWTRPSSKSL